MTRSSGYYRTVVTKRVAKKQLLRSEKLGKLAWLVHAFSTRHGGVSRAYGGNALNLGFTKQDSRAAVERNRELFLKELGVPNGHNGWPLVSLRQIHSDLIHRVDRMPEQPLAGDGLVTDTPGLVLAVQTADCLSIILVDRSEEHTSLFRHSDLIHRVDRMPEQPMAGDGLVTDTPGLVLAVQTADCLSIILVDPKRRAVGVFHAGWRGTVKRIVEKGVGEMRRHFKSDPRNL